MLPLTIPSIFYTLEVKAKVEADSPLKQVDHIIYFQSGLSDTLDTAKRRLDSAVICTVSSRLLPAEKEAAEGSHSYKSFLTYQLTPYYDSQKKVSSPLPYGALFRPVDDSIFSHLLW